jgi:hypothetical protein
VSRPRPTRCQKPATDELSSSQPLQSLLSLTIQVTHRSPSIINHDDDSTSACRRCRFSTNAELFWNAAIRRQQSQSLLAQLVLAVVFFIVILQRTIALARLWVDAITSSPNGPDHAARHNFHERQRRTTTTTSSYANAIGIGHGHGELGLLCRHSRLLKATKVLRRNSCHCECTHAHTILGELTYRHSSLLHVSYPFCHTIVALTIQ